MIHRMAADLLLRGLPEPPHRSSDVLHLGPVRKGRHVQGAGGNQEHRAGPPIDYIILSASLLLHSIFT